MTFAEEALFFYTAFATVAFTCQLAYFTVLGLRVALKDRQLGTSLRLDEEAYRALIGKQR